MSPTEPDDSEFIDRLLERNAEFREFMEERRREADEGKVLSLEEVRKRLELGPSAP